ncbi:hypothetical protein [Epinotia aporema granulovirus]|uniref:Uncharacterized protein n=1 Tax=Epinotia aporema granulovirus TaxID=166056 RepID=K4ERV7_9BBAC|nr:hypothetical protein [Epinotia aporema granulovirus]AER41555.1 hypothetical protein [Epinotia aporema granulovirus]
MYKHNNVYRETTMVNSYDLNKKIPYNEHGEYPIIITTTTLSIFFKALFFTCTITALIFAVVYFTWLKKIFRVYIFTT